MEENEREALPTELWCHILTFVDDFDDIISLKNVNRLFHQELGARDPLMSVDKAIKISEEMRKWFRNRIPHISIPINGYSRATKRTSMVFRVVFVGPSCSGKTTFLTRLADGLYKDDIESTVGARFFRKGFDPEANGLTCRMEIWDTSGVEKYTPLSSIYIRGAESIFLTFSLDNRDSFITSINRWLPQLYQNFQHYDPQSQPIIYLLGLKSDLERKVSTSHAKTLARVLKIKYFECSAKLNENVNEVVEELKNDLLKSMRSNNGVHQTNSFVRVIRTYLKGRNAIFVCFSIDNRDSFVNGINGWLPEISSANRQLKPEQQPLMYLLGFRSDLEDQRQVSTKEAKAVARALRMKYFECSSKLNHNVNEVMEEVKNDLLATIRLSMNASNTKTDASESKRWCLVQ